MREWFVVFNVNVSPLPAVKCRPLYIHPSFVVTVVPIFFIVPFHINETANDTKQDVGVVDNSTEEAWVLDAACGGHNEIAEL